MGVYRGENDGITAVYRRVILGYTMEIFWNSTGNGIGGGWVHQDANPSCVEISGLSLTIPMISTTMYSQYLSKEYAHCFAH